MLFPCLQRTVAHNQILRDVYLNANTKNRGNVSLPYSFIHQTMFQLSQCNISISLDVVPRDHRFLAYRTLEVDASKLLNNLLEMMASPHITACKFLMVSICSISFQFAANLMTCMQSLTTIARARPMYMRDIISSLEALHVNLPPTLSKSQVCYIFVISTILIVSIDDLGGVRSKIAKTSSTRTIVTHRIGGMEFAINNIINRLGRNTSTNHEGTASRFGATKTTSRREQGQCCRCYYDISNRH
jgi:hypothetical protein